MESLPQRIGDLFPRTNRHRLTMTNATHLHKRTDTPESQTRKSLDVVRRRPRRCDDDAIGSSMRVLLAWVGSDPDAADPGVS